jgi:hypothetical protein
MKYLIALGEDRLRLIFNILWRLVEKLGNFVLKYFTLFDALNGLPNLSVFVRSLTILVIIRVILLLFWCHNNGLAVHEIFFT